MIHKYFYFLIASFILHSGLHGSDAMDFSMPAQKMAQQEDVQHHSMPPITLVKEGEFVIQKIRIVNDSRNEETRSAEIRDTLKLIIEKAKEFQYEIRFGQSNVNLDNYKDIPIQGYSNKSDVSTIKVEIKKNTNPTVGTPVVDDIEKALIAIKPIGRSDIVKEEFGLGIANPEKYRYELLSAIIADIKKVQGLLGNDSKFNLIGLDKRIRWKRHSFNQLELYIDYSFSFSNKESK